MGENATVERIIQALKIAPESTLEWMVHPGYRQQKGNGDDFSRSEERELEMQNLRTVKSKLDALNIKLISWLDVVVQ